MNAWHTRPHKYEVDGKYSNRAGPVKQCIVSAMPQSSNNRHTERECNPSNRPDDVVTSLTSTRTTQPNHTCTTPTECCCMMHALWRCTNARQADAAPNPLSLSTHRAQRNTWLTNIHHHGTAAGPHPHLQYQAPNTKCTPHIDEHPAAQLCSDCLQCLPQGTPAHMQTACTFSTGKRVGATNAQTALCMLCASFSLLLGRLLLLGCCLACRLVPLALLCHGNQLGLAGSDVILRQTQQRQGCRSGNRTATVCAGIYTCCHCTLQQQTQANCSASMLHP